MGSARTHLCPRGIEELVWVNAVADRASDKGEPVEDQGRLVGFLEQQLAQDIDHDG